MEENKEETVVPEEKVLARAKSATYEKTLASNVHPAIFRPAMTELEGTFPFSCGRCKREHTVRYAWQYFCAECMDDMDTHVDYHFS